MSQAQQQKNKAKVTEHQTDTFSERQEQGKCQLLQERARLIRDVYKAVLTMEDHTTLDTSESDTLSQQVQNRVMAYQLAVQALKEHQRNWPIDEEFALKFLNQRVDGVY